MTDELEICRAAAAKVEELEKENKRLAQELQTKLKEDATLLAKPAPRIHYGNILDLTPGSSEPPSSVARIEPGESNQAVQKKYDDLAKRYNKVCQKYDAMKGAKEYAETVAKDEKTKSQKWSDWGKNMSEKVEKKDEKIRKLKEEIKELKSKLDAHDNEVEQQHETDKEPHVIQPRQASSPVKQNVGEGVQVPASSPPKAHQQGIERFAPLPKQMADVEVNDGHGHPTAKQMDLPPMRDEESYIRDTSFEPLEAHHTSSTEGDPDLPLPTMIVREDAAADIEAETKTPSSPAVFISARSVKKRKARDQNVDETPGPRIKTEIIELSSPHTPIPAYIDTNESMDLDDIGEKVSTPRKVQRVAALSRSTAPSQTSGQNRGNASNAAASMHSLREKSVLQPRSVNTSILPRTSNDTRAPKKRRIASDRDVAGLTEDGEIPATKGGLRRQTSNSDERLIELLSKPSPDKRVLSPQQTRTSVQTSMLSALHSERTTNRPEPALISALACERLGETNHKGPNESKPVPEKPKASREHTPNSRPSSIRASREPLEPLDLTASSAKRIVRGPPESSRPSSGQAPRSSAEAFRPSSKTSSRSSNEPQISDEKISGRSPSPAPGTQLPARRDLASAFKSRTVQELAKASPRTPPCQ